MILMFLFQGLIQLDVVDKAAERLNHLGVVLAESWALNL